MKSFGVALLGLLFVGVHSLTEMQLQSTAKLMRNVCQPKSKVTDEEIDNMHKGLWDGASHNAMCYIKCFMKSMKMVKPDGKVNWEQLKTQMTQMPEARRAPSSVSFEKCSQVVDEMTTEDKCELAYGFAKCVYFDNPDNYFFP